MKQYINAVELFNLISQKDYDEECSNKALEGVALAFKSLKDDEKHIIRLSCNAEICEAIF